jgi:hypothetical protein
MFQNERFEMQSSAVKRHAIRGLLTLHFVGLALTLGLRFASLVIYGAAPTDDLRALVFSREVTGALSRSLALPGLALLVVTGAAMVFLRYGRRVPVWIWIKILLTTAAVSLASPLVAPALAEAREWAHWSLDHGYLASQFKEAAARASRYGGVVFGLFFLNIPIAVWKPLSALRLSDLLPSRWTRRDAARDPSEGDDRVSLKASPLAVGQYGPSPLGQRKRRSW